MPVNRASDIIDNKIEGFKRKFYLNKLLKGGLLFLALFGFNLLFFTTFEYFASLSSLWRAIFFYSFLAISLSSFFYWIAPPLISLLVQAKQLKNEEAALIIGGHFPQIKDKLLNLIQLRNKISPFSLAEASVSQRSHQLSVYSFPDAINLRNNWKVARTTLIIVVSIVLISLLYPSILIQSGSRIVQYQKEFKPSAPFDFIIMNEALSGFVNEDYDLIVKLEGSFVPDNLFLVTNESRTEMVQQGSLYKHKIKSNRNTFDFALYGAGYFSEKYTIRFNNRPSLSGLSVNLIYPKYLRMDAGADINSGSLVVPEGTQIIWNIRPQYSDSVLVQFSDDPAPVSISTRASAQVSFVKTATNNFDYTVELVNEFSKNKDLIRFSVSCVKDEFPTIRCQTTQDTSQFSYLFSEGTIEDDHGISGFRLVYSQEESMEKKSFKPLKFEPSDKYQPFYHAWDMGEINTAKPGSSIYYYYEVFDNDGVNGRKSSRTPTFSYRVPDKEQINSILDKTADRIQKKMSAAAAKSLELKKDLKKLKKNSLSKPNLDWQDKKDIQSLLEDYKDLLSDVEEINEMNEEIKSLEDAFKNLNPELMDKVKHLSELMEETLDEETKKLLEELEKLISESRQDEKIKKALEKMDQKANNLENELDRTLELYKNLLFDKKLDEAIEELNELAKEQLAASESKLSAEERKEEQEALNKKFESVEEKLEELKKINDGLNDKRSMENIDKEMDEIKSDQQKSKSSFDKADKKEGSKAQKSAASKMQELSIQLSSNKSKNKKKKIQENIDDLRAILHNLINLSFDQEEVMINLRVINQSDPQYVKYLQKELKIREDAQMIEDSLLALGKRVFQLQSFITREVGGLKSSIDESITLLKDRKPAYAAMKQQYAMTSANNLALLLDDVLKSLQEQMNSAMKGEGSCEDPGNNQKGNNPSPGPGNLGQMQQEINDRINQLKNGSKGEGEGMSEELARLAAQQEMIRNALKELEKMLGKKKGGEQAGGGLGDMAGKMEETEKDLVNKKIGQETLKRQQEILTRLLEAEKALKERDYDDERESKQAKTKPQKMPPSYEEYLKKKEKQIEQIRIIDPALRPFYKDEVGRYFKSLNDKLQEK